MTKKQISISDLYSIYLGVSGVSTDTRTIESGQMFFALKGPNFDGNKKAEEAVNKGAAFVVIDDPNYEFLTNSILVKDSLATLQALAKYHRSKQSIDVIGITGSNGKTTTKELMHSVLIKKYKAYATKGNYNNHIGVPLTVLNAPIDSNLWIVEMGANQPGDIAELCEICQPSIGLITNIGLAHLEKLIDQNGVYREKTSLFDFVRRRDGYIFINTKDPYLNSYKNEYQSSKYIPYNNENCGYGALKQISQPEELLSMVLLTKDGQKFAQPTNLSGAYNIMNISAALNVGSFFNVPVDDAIEAIKSYMPQNMRSQIIKTLNNEIVIDTYNANPSSMAISLGEFIDSSDQKSFVVLGDMLELGIASRKYHQDIYDQLINSGLEYYLVGDMFSKVCTNNERVFRSVNELKVALQTHPLIGKRVFIKGSRGIKLEQIVDLL